MLRSLFALLLTLALLCAALPTVATAGRGDWWMFHHDVKHTGRSAFTGPNNPMVKWAFPHGCGKASPVQDADGTLYVGGDSLYAINPDGTQKWTFANEGNDTVPAIGSDGTIYVGAGDGNLYAVNPNGTKKWVYPTHGTISDNPAIGANGTIYIATVVYYTYSDMQDDYSGNSGDPSCHQSGRHEAMGHGIHSHGDSFLSGDWCGWNDLCRLG